MKTMHVSFIHSKGSFEISMELDEGVLKDSIDNDDVAKCIEVITDFQDVEVLSIDLE